MGVIYLKGLISFKTKIYIDNNNNKWTVLDLLIIQFMQFILYLIIGRVRIVKNIIRIKHYFFFYFISILQKKNYPLCLWPT